MPEFIALTFTPVPQAAADEAKAAGIAVRLEEPDDLSRPTAWQGPMTISQSGTNRYCKSDLSLITKVYSARGAPYLIVLSYSGSVRYIHYINTADCRERWPATKLFTDAISVSGDTIEIQPVCECPDSAKPCTCAAARVLRVTANASPADQQDKALALTKRVVGIAFIGQAKVKAPGTPAASLVSGKLLPR